MIENNKLISEKLQITNDINATYCNLFDEILNQHLGQTIDYFSILSELKVIGDDLKQEIHECRNINRVVDFIFSLIFLYLSYAPVGYRD